MRITGGKFGGRTLAGPKDDSIRPTSDMVRQAVFNVLAHNDFGAGFALEGAKALDLFAGTGAMGLEALSRGAKFCLFVEQDAKARALIRENVEALNLTGASKIWRRDATALGPMAANANGPYDLVFLDPPYRKNLVPLALQSARAGGWLAPHAVAVAEIAADEEFTVPEGFALHGARSYGGTKIVVLIAA